MDSPPALVVVFDGPKSAGRRLFESFIAENRASFWNSELVSAVSSLVYMGSMRPATIFVSSPHSHHLNTIKVSWSRRVLKPALGYSIKSLGDMGATRTVEQSNFVPLGPLLCDAIVEMSKEGRAATQHSLRQRIHTDHPQLPSSCLDLLPHTLNSLLASGIVYQMGPHFFISGPAATPPSCAVECQTGESIVVGDSKKEKKEERREDNRAPLGFLTRLFARAPKKATPLVFTAQFPPPEWLPAQKSFVPAVASHPLASTQRYGTYEAELCEEARRRRTRRCERRVLSSSSECLNYGPIDPPECVPGDVEVIDDLRRRRRRARRCKAEARTSTPVDSDSALETSPQDTATSDDAHSDPETHIYVNYGGEEETQFEECDGPTLLALDAQPSLPSVNNVHISNV